MTVIETPVVSATGSTPAEPTRYSFAPDRPDQVARWTTIGLLVATAVLYLWGLSASGYANSFYSAAAQAGSQNWTAWFFGSLDGGNSITVDKPPAAIWLMALSVRLFGLSSWSILVPEALLGVASVGVLYVTLRRTLTAWAGDSTSHGLSPRGAHWAALAGAAVFALTPAATSMFRFNNPGALLVFTMVLASYFTVRASENGSRGWLALAGVAIGFGFLTTMLQAFLVLPALVVAYAIAAPVSWRKKIVDLLVAFAAMVASFGWYVAVVELTPASLRPYIGGSQSNSLLDLILNHNGLGRITGTEVGPVGGGGSRWGSTGLTRMFDGVSGGMISWLIPAGLILGTAALAFLMLRRSDPGAAGTGQSSRQPLAGQSSRQPLAGQSPSQALAGGITIWLGWLVVTGLVFSFMAGTFHDYYTVALAPGIAGAAALGAAALWADRGRQAPRLVLATTALLTGLWSLQLLNRAGGWYTVLGWSALAASTLAAAGLVVAHRLPRVLALTALGIGFAAAMLGPAAYSINTAATAHKGSIVTAGPVSSGAGGLLNGSSVSTDLAILLSTNADAYTWVAASVGSQSAASYQLATGDPVMALGGFNGSDPSPTLDQFKAYVAAGKIHYFIGGSGVGGRQNGGSNAASKIAAWVADTYDATTVGNTTVYDLTAA